MGMKITVLSGGIGGARFIEGLLAACSPQDQITVIANTADDIWLFGLKICPDLDTLMYTLGGGIDVERRWGRIDESWNARDELAAYGVEPTWFGLGDKDLATHLVRTQMLQAGYSLSDITKALCQRWQPGVEMLPMSDDRIETHVVIDDPAAESGQRAIHFQEYWVRLRASAPVRDVVVVGIDQAAPAPGVVQALTSADLVMLPPSNPIVSIGTIVGVPGVQGAIATTDAPVVGVSPIVGGSAVRGMADQLLTGLGIEVSASAVARHYGSRKSGGLLDGWLIDSGDAAELGAVRDAGIAARAVPLMMTDTETTRTLAEQTLAFAGELSSGA